MTTKNQKQPKKYKEDKSKNIRIYLDYSDKKAIIRTTLIILFFATFYFLVKVDIKDFFIRHNRSWAITIGEVQSIEDITGIEHTLVGNRITTFAYKIEYCYIVGGIRYKQMYVSGRTNVVDFVSFIRPFDKIEIYYKKKNPTESYINFDTNSDFYKKKI